MLSSRGRSSENPSGELKLTGDGTRSAKLGETEIIEFRVAEEREEKTEAWSDDERGYEEFDEFEAIEL